MQVGKVSWIGQTFALARCSDSQGKKPRSRRTKEERRKMVESFIKRYRDSNNGNFPSLNLTHKEVGGSFYTVREIVRQIIQENKVLRPGSLNSQAFSLDDCSEQHLPEPFTSDYMYKLSLMTTEHSSDERQMGDSNSGENQNVDKMLPAFSLTLSDHDTASTNEEFALHSHDVLIPQVIDGDSYEEKHRKSWHGNVHATNEESSKELSELSGQEQNYSPTEIDEELYLEVKDKEGENCAKYETEDPLGISQPLSTSSTFGVSIVKDKKSGMHVNDTNKVVYSFSERKNVLKTGYVCDKLEKPSSPHHEGSSPRHTGEVYPLQSTDYTISGSEQMAIKEAGGSDNSGPTEASVIANENVSYVPVFSDPTTNSMESFSSTTATQKVAISVKAPISGLLDCPTYESVKLQVAEEVVTSVTGRASGKPGLENCMSNSNAEGRSSLDGTNRETSETREKVENAETNPLFAIIIGLVTAFIKFWTE